MILNTEEKPEKNRTAGVTLHLLSLVPHRDVLNLFDPYRRMIFAAGFHGAFSFPPAAPLAILSGPPEKNRDKNHEKNYLKELANEIRAIGKEGKISAGDIEMLRLTPAETENFTYNDIWKTTSFFGPLLDLPLHCISGLKNDSIIHIFPKAVLCAAIINTACTYIDTGTSGQKSASAFSAAELKTMIDRVSVELKPFSFRAAKLTCIAIRPLRNGAAPFSLEWRLGPERWLPAYRPPK